MNETCSSAGITLVSIVLMHLLCNALRVFLGVMVVVLVGESKLKLGNNFGIKFAQPS